MPVSAEIDIGFETRRKAVNLDAPGGPFRMALLGDFSGHASRGAPRRVTVPITIDSGNVGEVMELLDVSTRLTIGGRPVDISFHSLDDFHPDALQVRLPVFQSLERLRADVNHSATFSAAAGWLREQLPSARARSGVNSERGTAAAAQPALDPAQAWDSWIGETVASHCEVGAEAGPDEWTAAIDGATGDVMREILSAPAFRCLESAWRSVSFLLERLASRADLRIDLIDVAKEELKSLPVIGWSVAACLHRFAPEPQDCRLLARMAAMGRRANGPVLAEIGVRLAGCGSIADTPNPDDWCTPLDEADYTAWRWLRADPDARWLGLALPRLLLRLPYSRAGGEIACLAFEEMPSPAHESYLWGSPAVACACLLGEAFLQRGWNMRPGQMRRLSGLPVHHYRCNGEKRTVPPAEVWLTEHRAERILDDGAIPLISLRSSDSLRVLRFQSVAEPPAPLAGPWESAS